MRGRGDDRVRCDRCGGTMERGEDVIAANSGCVHVFIEDCVRAMCRRVNALELAALMAKTQDD